MLPGACFWFHPLQVPVGLQSMLRQAAGLAKGKDIGQGKTGSGLPLDNFSFMLYNMDAVNDERFICASYCSVMLLMKHHMRVRKGSI